MNVEWRLTSCSLGVVRTERYWKDGELREDLRVLRSLSGKPSEQLNFSGSFPPKADIRGCQ
jgi:hypothetical protein